MIRAAACLLVGLLGWPQLAFAQRMVTRQEEVRSSERSPHSALEAQRERFQWSEAVLQDPAARYELSDESFWLCPPKKLKKRQKYGLLVWISPGATGLVPPFWEKELNRRKMIGIGANRSGNARHIAVRIGLALDAAHYAMQRFQIDPERVYVAGFSGGGRMSSFLALHHPELFRGAIYFGGCDYFRDVPVPEGRGMWRGVIPEPTPARLELAKTRSRHVYQTGERDEGALLQTQAVERLAREDGFRYTLYLEVPKLEHAVPDGKWLAKCVRFLDDPPEPKSE